VLFGGTITAGTHPLTATVEQLKVATRYEH
jgi:hypothetical protein